jgi:hypothetical protein
MCEECGERPATGWDFDLALCLECRDTIAMLLEKIKQESSR